MIRRLKARLAGSNPRDDAGHGGAPTPRWAQPIEVPPCPEGWRTGPPDFVGIPYPKVMDEGTAFFDYDGDGDVESVTDPTGARTT